MTRVPQIHIVESPDGDWVGLYVNGELKFQGHSLSGSECLEALGIPFKRDDANDAWISRVGTLPANIEDVFWQI